MHAAHRLLESSAWHEAAAGIVGLSVRVCCAKCCCFLHGWCIISAGKRVKVEPLTAVATPYLRQLLSALLLLVQSASSAAAGSNNGNKVTAMVEMDRCLKLQSMVVQARHCLAPALRGGNRACQGR
jgi:hypothetical protein